MRPYRNGKAWRDADADCRFLTGLGLALGVAVALWVALLWRACEVGVSPLFQ